MTAHLTLARRRLNVWQARKAGNEAVVDHCATEPQPECVPAQCTSFDPASQTIRATENCGAEVYAPVEAAPTTHKFLREPPTSYPPTSKPGFFFPLPQKPGKKSTRTPMSGRSLDQARVSILRSGSTNGCTMTIKHEPGVEK